MCDHVSRELSLRLRSDSTLHPELHMTQLDPFKTALQFTLNWERGAGHPEDIGGVVQHGITQATYDAYLRRNNLPLKSVREITPAEVEPIYDQMYWTPSHANLMILPLAVVHFDTAVNFSVRASIEFLQEALGGLVIDGDFGLNTRSKLEDNNTLETAQRYCQARMDYRYYRVETNPTQKIFLEGWLKRDHDLLRYISELESEIVPPPKEHTHSDVVDKLDQAISLLQEVVEQLKQSHQKSDSL